MSQRTTDYTDSFSLREIIYKRSTGEKTRLLRLAMIYVINIPAITSKNREWEDIKKKVSSQEHTDLEEANQTYLNKYIILEN